MDVAQLRSLFQSYEQESKRLAAMKLPRPAYDFCLKCSHVFNLLDARGAISVTERTGYIGRVRDLARAVAGEYLSQREAMGFPLLKKSELTGL
jgi:glycyl-tRNA synthetase alpha chain